MGRGVHRGFITLEELKKSLGKRNLSNQNLEQAFIHILDEKVALVEKWALPINEVLYPDFESSEAIPLSAFLGSRSIPLSATPFENGKAPVKIEALAGWQTGDGVIQFGKSTPLSARLFK